MIGPAVPVPVSQDVLDALQSVKVVTGSGGTPGGFELTFSLSTRSPLHTIFLLAGGASIPLVRVVIAVTVNGTTEVLMDGVMTNHRVAQGSDAGHAVLTVMGKDLSAVMDYIDFGGIPYPCMPAEARVALILAKYLVLGCAPLVIPSILIDVPIPVEQIPKHVGTDLQYVKYLADKVGYVFYIDPGPRPGTSVAYWGPEIRVGTPQPALNFNMDAETNVESLSFSWETDKKTLPILLVQEPISKLPLPIPVPDVTPLSPPLGLIPPIPKHFDFIAGLGKYSFLQAAVIGLAKAARTADAAFGSGKLDVLRYGRVLKARRLVGVRGVGPAFDGLYYVKGVIHEIKRGEYKQSFTLARNGLLSTFDKVPA
jgi:hypothetical protein